MDVKKADDSLDMRENSPYLRLALFTRSCNMSDAKAAADGESRQCKNSDTALEPPDDDARSCVINYIVARLEIALRGEFVSPGAGAAEPSIDEAAETGEEQAAAPKYAALAELFDAAQPKSNADKALKLDTGFRSAKDTEVLTATRRIRS